MAMIESIRKRGMLAVIVVGAGMLLFLIPPDAIQSLTGKGANRDILEAGGHSMGAMEWTKELQSRRELFNYNNNEMGLLNDVMNDFVERSVLNKDYDRLGLTVTDEEFEGILFGDQLSPYVKRTFYNNMDSLSLKEKMRKNFDDMHDTNYDMYIGYKNMIIQRRLREKYDQLLKKGLYANSIEAKWAYKMVHDSVDVQFVAKGYTEIADSLVTFNEGDMRAYYNKHKKDEEWKQEESRTIAYLKFPVTASASDTAALLAELNDIKKLWANAKNDSAFVVEYGVTPNFIELGYHDFDYTGPENTQIMNDSIGSIIGPYIDFDYMRIAKIRSRKMEVDSVQARHILLKGDIKTEKPTLTARADSLKKVIKANNNFADMARQFGSDGTKDKGGDLGWFGRGQMVKPFEDACFDGKQGELQIVETQFGIHIVEVTAKKDARLTTKLAVIDRQVKPSPSTVSQAYNTANDVSLLFNDTIKLRDYADTSGYSLIPIPNVKRTSTALGSLTEASDIIRWAYRKDTELGAVSQPFQLESDYIIAALTEIREQGAPSFDNVKDKVKKEVANEKKAELIISQVKDAANLDEAAATLKTTVKKATLSMSRNNLPQSGTPGNEYEVVGLCFGIPENKMSVPIQGKGGVFILAPSGPVRMGAQTSNFIEDQDKMIKNLQGRSGVQIFNALKDEADVKDQRFDQ